MEGVDESESSYLMYPVKQKPVEERNKNVAHRTSQTIGQA